ncbi:4-alpha-glucanotransferase [Planosporangium flavigriseum]|uniref:4-alpha-glucanotransferase n=1 Tax=Planosporangium flavigriseum TaxID=373681 RepID=A0A8J3LVF0_9ACTN|nr:4-alpha-glucanotransferase [Planosporangium flavigriseum]NJC65245.1 4-alpha-glucanotransferase [Planosporangium flavigriseum]GIG71865.1 4-alpha-glucanotransferase [Planosporangium flavigriseum]
MADTTDQELAELAAAHGVATSYEDWRHRRVEVDPDVVRTILGLLDVATGTPADVRRELARVRERDRARALPPTVVVRPGQRWALPRGANGVAYGEDDAAYDVVDGAPVTLPLGWYRLTVAGSESTLVVAPERLPAPPPAWGWMLQLYAVHSGRSWGVGDLSDLRTFTDWAADAGQADLVLLNPLHAVATVPAVQASPYSPSSRRFANPLYLAVEDTDAYRRAEPAARARVDALRPDATGQHIDYDRAWQAKRTALELLFPYAEPIADLDPGLRDFATFCALAEVHGHNWQAWPAELRRPDSPAVVAARAKAGDRVAFHAWLQRETARQLGRAQDGARAAGMRVGLIHDLAVGVDPGGADGWLLQDVLAPGVTAGAPPDGFNQQGQDWGLAAWRPDRLAETGYAAYRDMLRSVLAHAGGVRVDHVMGLWRLWWVPPGASADQGTYVSYDDEAMLAILALEAHRAGAAVVAEDLGTVEPRVTRGLREANMLGSQVLWFAREEKPDDTGVHPFQPPADWPAGAMASISTHDLPTAAGMLEGEHVRVRAELGLLGDVEAEAGRARADRRALVALLRREGLVADDPTDDELVVGMHGLLAASPCRFLLASPYDALGERRQPNLPGTVDQYPNWRIPLPVPLEAMSADPRMHRVAELLGRARPRAAG